MQIMLILLVLINSVFGDQLGRRYLPPLDAHISVEDLSSSDLSFELPNDYPKSDYIPISEIKTIEYGFNNTLENDRTTYDDTITTRVLYNSTTSQPITDRSSTLPPPTTMAHFINGLKNTISQISQFDNIESGNGLHVNKLDGFSTRFEEEFKYAAKPLPVSETNVFSKEYINIDLVDPNIEFGKDNVLFDKKHNTYVTSSKEPSLESLKTHISYNDNSAITTNEINNLTSVEFSYSFDTSNGLHADMVGSGTDGVKSKGTFSYTGDDGKLYMMEYTADENGFKPKGAHLPTPPPIPKEIQNVIEQAYKDKAAGIFHDGFYSEERYGHTNYMAHIKKKVTTENKSHATHETRGMIRPTFLGEIGTDYISKLSTNMPIIEEIVPEKLTYDQGDDYVQTSNKIMDIPRSIITILPKLYTSQESMYGTKEIIDNSNSTANITNTENSNVFESSTPNEYMGKSETYYETTPVLPSAYNYDMNYISFDEKPKEISPAEMSLFGKPIYYFDDLNNQGHIRTNNYTEIVSTKNPDDVATDIPSTETNPIYISNQVNGEDFSGPKQKPAYNTNSGYYY